MSDDSRTRFLVAIASHLPAERVAEVHLFGSIRQGGTESGVAVLALELPPEPEPLPEVSATVQPVTDGAEAEEPVEDTPGDARPEDEPLVAPRPRAAPRYSVYSARYRHTLKGLDRGKWEVSVTEEALAPLLTIDAVVRGVQRRSGDADETTRLSGDEFRAALPAALPAAAATSAVSTPGA